MDPQQDILDILRKSYQPEDALQNAFAAVRDDIRKKTGP
jgi:hypothetical protein